jgi:hypothetical protein
VGCPLEYLVAFKKIRLALLFLPYYLQHFCCGQRKCRTKPSESKICKLQGFSLGVMILSLATVQIMVCLFLYHQWYALVSREQLNGTHEGCFNHAVDTEIVFNIYNLAPTCIPSLRLHLHAKTLIAASRLKSF